MTLEELEAEALKLNSNSRSRLAETLLHSLKGLSEAEIERFWAEEALRRDEELESGNALHPDRLRKYSATPDGRFHEPLAFLPCAGGAKELMEATDFYSRESGVGACLP